MRTGKQTRSNRYTKAPCIATGGNIATPLTIFQPVVYHEKSDKSMEVFLQDEEKVNNQGAKRLLCL